MNVTVIFNGIPKVIEIPRGAYGATLMDRAKHEFQPSHTLGQLALFVQNGSQLAPNGTLAIQGVKDGDSLLLRPTVIR